MAKSFTRERAATLRIMPVSRLLMVVTLMVSASIPRSPYASDEIIPSSRRALAPDFRLLNADGVTRRLSGLRGKVVLVNFWASWCPPCRSEMPSLERLRDRLDPRAFTILAIGMGEDVTGVRMFARSFRAPLRFELLPDPDNAVQSRWAVRGIPESFLVDRRGRIAYHLSGALEWDAPPARALVRELMREGGILAGMPSGDPVFGAVSGLTPIAHAAAVQPRILSWTR